MDGRYAKAFSFHWHLFESLIPHWLNLGLLMSLKKAVSWDTSRISSSNSHFICVVQHYSLQSVQRPTLGQLLTKSWHPVISFTPQAPPQSDQNTRSIFNTTRKSLLKFSFFPRTTHFMHWQHQSTVLLFYFYFLFKKKFTITNITQL